VPPADLAERDLDHAFALLLGRPFERHRLEYIILLDTGTGGIDLLLA